MTLPGPPIFFAGDELGLQDVPIPEEMRKDPFAERVPGYGLGRDPERAPMPWNEEENAGFTAGQPWLPVAGDRTQQNVAAMRSRSGSILHLYRWLITLRQEEPALRGSEYETMRASEEGTFVFRRGETGRPIFVALNLTATPQRIGRLGSQEGRVLLSTCLNREGDRLSREETLRPHEGVIVTPE